jgi:hypothetical protein
MIRIVVLSDIHLSPTHGFFWENWCVEREFADAARVDAVIVMATSRSTDLIVTARLRSQLPHWGTCARESWPCLATTMWATSNPARTLTRSSMQIGSHDGTTLLPPIAAPWMSAAGAWLVSMRSFGSGLMRENAQDQWLDDQLRTAGGPTAIFLHKPLFLERPTDDVSPACMVPQARTRLLDKLNRSDVCLMVSGHLHQHHDRAFGGQRHLWVSAAAFAGPQVHGGDVRCSVTVLDLSHDSVEVTIERPRGLVSHDLAAIKGHGRYQFLRDMLPSPAPHAG